MNSKRPTIEDVAQRAQVSIKTVSRVLNNAPHVRPTTRDRVRNAARELEYRPNLSARRLASNRSFVIGMLYDNPNPDYVTQIQYGSLRVCRERGYSLLILPYDSKSPSLVGEVIGLRRQATVDGFVVLQPLSDLEELNQQLLEHRIPTVRIAQRQFEGLPQISVGDREAADRMTEYLIELGHRRIGFIMGHPAHGSSHDRLEGHRTALERHGIRFESRLVERGMFDYESGYAGARNLLSLQPRPTAIFASNDLMAMAALTAAHEIRLDIPGDLSVAGFDDTSVARFAWPPLTTMRQPIAEVARIATESLLRILEDEHPGDHCLKAEIVRRASTGKPPAAAATG